MRKTIFLIDTAYHKRWMLPDEVHYYNSVLFGEYFHVTIWNNRTGELVLSLPDIYIDNKGQWRDLLETAQELAEKKFRKQDSKAVQFQNSHRRKK